MLKINGWAICVGPIRFSSIGFLHRFFIKESEIQTMIAIVQSRRVRGSTHQSLRCSRYWENGAYKYAPYSANPSSRAPTSAKVI
jgi:hypothetical protein